MIFPHLLIIVSNIKNAPIIGDLYLFAVFGDQWPAVEIYSRVKDLTGQQLGQPDAAHTNHFNEVLSEQIKESVIILVLNDILYHAVYSTNLVVHKRYVNLAH